MPTSKQEWQATLAVCLFMLLFFCFDALVIQYFSSEKNITVYLISFVLLCFGHYWLSAYINISLKYIFILSALVKIPLIFSNPFLSDDIYRYLWDGFVSQNGINPYQHAPDAYALEMLAKQYGLHEFINHPKLSTLYLLIPQAIFYLSSIFFNSMESLKFIFLVFDLASLFLLSKLIPITDKRTLLLFAFHPLILMESYSSGHFEIIYVFFVLLALYAYKNKKQKAFVTAIVLGTLTKGFSLLYLTFKRKWLVPFVVCCLFGYFIF